MDWGNCIIRRVHKGDGGAVTAIDADLHLEGDFKKTRLKLTWLAECESLVPLRLVEFGPLITKPKARPFLFFAFLFVFFLFFPFCSWHFFSWQRCSEYVCVRLRC